MGDPVVVEAPSGPSSHSDGWAGIDEEFTAGFTRSLGLKEAATVASAVSKMRRKSLEGRQIATLTRKNTNTSSRSSTQSLSPENICVPPGHEWLESILVQRAGVRVRDNRINRRRPPSSDIKSHEKKVNLSLRMMFGVRVSVGRLATESGRQELEKDDFTEIYAYKFPSAGRAGDPSTPSHQLNKTFQFKDYAPKAFKSLRSLFGIDELSYTLSVAGVYDYLELITNSKSGSFFFFSHDLKYIIKSMQRSEAKFFQRILPKYYEHHCRNPDAFLVRFCGMYMVKSDRKKIPFLVMKCIDGMALDKIHTKYDLKGSSWHRKAKEGDKVLKDNNLREADGKFCFGSQREAILKALRADAEFLRDVNVMDYSAFMSVHDSSRAMAPSDRRKLLHREYAEFFVFLDDEPAFVRLPAASSSKNNLIEEKGQEEEGKGGEGLDQGDKKEDVGEVTEEQTKPAASARRIRIRTDGGIESEGDGPKEVYWMGIIDVLTEFTILRRMEALYKSIVWRGNKVSCVEPGLYCERFVDFMVERTA